MKTLKRPSSPHGSTVTTPHAAMMMQLLGSGVTAGGVTLTRDEFTAVKKLYGYKREKPNKKPAPPIKPEAPAPGADCVTRRKFAVDLLKYEAAVKAHDKWTDPMPLMQAGADRNAIRNAEVDGLRLLAWFAKFVQPGVDPLKTLVQIADEAGCDVDPAVAEWADTEEELEDEG